MYERILVATDGSEGSRAAVEHAVDLASTASATLHAVYVVDATVGPDAGIVGALDALEEAGEAALDEVVHRAEAADVEPIEAVLLQGVPHRAILEYAGEHDVDLIVVGTHGRTGLDRYLLGSVAERVVRGAGVPVMTVRAPGDGSEARADDWRAE